MSLDEVAALTFDVFGTVVDWRSSVARELSQNRGDEACLPGRPLAGARRRAKIGRSRGGTK